MKVKIKKLHPDAVIPTYAHKGDAGMDLVAVDRIISTDNDAQADYIEYKTGLAFEIPEGYVGLLFPRSSNSKKDLTLANSVGIIDSHFRGEVTFRYKVDATYDRIVSEVSNKIVLEDKGDDQFIQLIYDVGDRVGQLIIIPYPQIEFEEVEELSETERGDGGYGSTGD